MSRFSPGPWRVLSDGTVWTDQVTPHPMGSMQPHGHAICKMAEQRTSMGSYFEEDDARLIAAAPEMMELLVEIRAHGDLSNSAHGERLEREIDALLARFEEEG